MKLIEIFILFALFCLFCVHAEINYNTVSVKLSRATRGIAKIIKKSCLLMNDEGPCRANIEMYHFKPELMDCAIFTWGGCQGNGNRYETREECLADCLSNSATRPPRPNYCNLKFDYGFCFGDLTRWFYDPKWGVCKQTLYSGCGGNKNNFYTEEGCDSVCRFNLGPPGRADNAPNMKKVLIMNPIDGSSPRDHGQRITTEPALNATVIPYDVDDYK